MLADPRRIIVTIVSIAGCCALLVIGFTVQRSIIASNKEQYERIVKYDYHIKYNSSLNTKIEKQIEDVLDSYNVEYLRSAYLSQPIITNDKLSLTNLICWGPK